MHKLLEIISTEFKFDPNSTENEGRWRLKDPKQFTNYFRLKSTDPRVPSKVKDAGAEGISYIMGKTAGYARDIQAIRFDRAIWTEDKAADWWENHKDKFEKTWSWNPMGKLDHSSYYHVQESSTRIVHNVWWDEHADDQSSKVQRCRTLEDAKRYAKKLIDTKEACRVQIKVEKQRQEPVTGIWTSYESKTYDMLEDGSWYEYDWAREYEE